MLKDITKDYLGDYSMISPSVHLCLLWCAGLTKTHLCGFTIWHVNNKNPRRPIFIVNVKVTVNMSVIVSTFTLFVSFPPTMMKLTLKASWMEGPWVRAAAPCALKTKFRSPPSVHVAAARSNINIVRLYFSVWRCGSRSWCHREQRPAEARKTLLKMWSRRRPRPQPPHDTHRSLQQNLQMYECTTAHCFLSLLLWQQTAESQSDHSNITKTSTVIHTHTHTRTNRVIGTGSLCRCCAACSLQWRPQLAAGSCVRWQGCPQVSLGNSWIWQQEAFSHKAGTIR